MHLKLLYKGIRMRDQLGTLALAEAYDKLYEEHQILKEKAKK